MKAFEYQPEFKRSVLDNGARVVTENHPFSRAVCAGITVDLGSRDEPEELSGAAHFVEHMVFKGTQTRDAYEISKSLEAVGGELNAYTTKEQTCFHATCLKEDLPMSLDLLSDLMSNAEFAVNDYKREREVILQEINMVGDELEEFAYDMFFAKAYKGHELGRPILGTAKSLNRISRKKLYDFYQRRYYGQNMIISVAGHVNHDEVCDIMNRTLNLRRRSVRTPERKKPKWQGFQYVKNVESEQTHVLVGLPSADLRDKLRFESYVLNAILGGGMTSRLYQKIRENKGLSYSVYSMVQPFIDTGMFTVYAGTSSQHVPKVIGAILRELEVIKKRGVTASELRMFKTQIFGNIILDADDVENRMNSLATAEILYADNEPLENIMKQIDAVSLGSINQYIKKYFDLSKLGMVVVGNVNEGRTEKLLKSYSN